MPGLIANSASLPAGGGPFVLQDITLGIFLSDQPTHRLTYGSSRAAHRPLNRNQGWILPAGSEGLCEFDAPLDMLSVSITQEVLQEVGMTVTEFAPVIGDIDPVLLSLSLGAEGYAKGGTLYRETMHRALAAQLAQVVAPAPDWQRDIADARLRRVMDYIHDSLADDLTLDAMADLAAMSATHFAKAFKRAVGSSPLQYVIGARLEMAAALLRTGDLSVVEIAWRVGYRDVSRFGQHFKRKFGATPAAYRADRT